MIVLKLSYVQLMHIHSMGSGCTAACLFQDCICIFLSYSAKAFGVGTYFARDASYSARPTYSTPDGNGHRYMYLALVLVGEFTVGSSNMLVPPAKDAAKDPNTPFDSLVNDTSNPSIFVIGPDAQSYPEYLIIFK